MALQSEILEYQLRTISSVLVYAVTAYHSFQNSSESGLLSLAVITWMRLQLGTSRRLPPRFPLLFPRLHLSAYCAPVSVTARLKPAVSPSVAPVTSLTMPPVGKFVSALFRQFDAAWSNTSLCWRVFFPPKPARVVNCPHTLLHWLPVSIRMT